MIRRFSNSTLHAPCYKFLTNTKSYSTIKILVYYQLVTMISINNVRTSHDVQASHKPVPNSYSPPNLPTHAPVASSHALHDSSLAALDLVATPPHW